MPRRASFRPPRAHLSRSRRAAEQSKAFVARAVPPSARSPRVCAWCTGCSRRYTPRRPWCGVDVRSFGGRCRVQHLSPCGRSPSRTGGSGRSHMNARLSCCAVRFASPGPRTVPNLTGTSVGSSFFFLPDLACLPSRSEPSSVVLVFQLIGRRGREGQPGELMSGATGDRAHPITVGWCRRG